MSYKQQLNAITRSILILSVIVLMISPSVRVFLVSLITIIMIYLMYYFQVSRFLHKYLGTIKDMSPGISHRLIQFDIN